MIQHPMARRRSIEERNQVALEVALVLYALVSTIILVRTVLVWMDVSDRVWLGRTVFGTTRLVMEPLAKLPGFGVPIFGPLTFADLFLVALVMLFPLGLIATSKR